MNPIAVQLNETIEKNAPAVLSCLSGLGKELYFPKGIISQGNEAKEKASRYNATIGTATLNGKPMKFSNIGAYFPDTEPADVFPYAPVAGRKKLRALWADKLKQQNPLLNSLPLSMPIVTGGITHGISIIADMFVNPGDTVLLPDMMWGNYRLTFGVYRGAQVDTYPFFDAQYRLDTAGFARSLKEAAQKTAGKVIVMFNFPNNPTGYTCSAQEAAELKQVLLETASAGTKILCLCDESYYGLFFDDCLKVSFFSVVAGQHENLMAVKLDGATKEYFVWGFRVGFITFGIKCVDPQPVYNALEQKISGLIRGTVSCLNHHAQTVIEKAVTDKTTETEWQKCFDLLRRVPPRLRLFTLPENTAGFGICTRLTPRHFRLHLLEKYQTGIISTSATDLRIAFSCLEEHDIEPPKAGIIILVPCLINPSHPTFNPNDKSGYVRQGFSEIAGVYDRFNDAVTFGMHRLWKRRVVKELFSVSPRRILDACCGSGDIALKAAHKAARTEQRDIQIIGLDFSQPMLDIAGNRNIYTNLEFRQGDILHSGFEDGAFDAISVGFGLRNVADIERCIAEFHRLLSPGGVLVILDMGKITAPVLKQLYGLFFFRLVPRIGGLLIKKKNRSMFDYFPRSTVNYPDRHTLTRMLEKSRFPPHPHNLVYVWCGHLAHCLQTPLSQYKIN
ncbi:hypothetical protein CHS0354_018492 [Potamilus streckersoni]|uniref:2-methoxy-6-polyprenyl-1,4-benzoquinol methylase, mitochondrial n=1 Tax=Potamilus streckersoni TaxID=2493646 RepID=A0AAE0TAI4_9BIVA|nr:hypothetical protein CHS0354_018492 [Potamilus streckersoni]